MLKHSYILLKFILFSGEGHDENVLVVPTSLKLSQSLLVTVLTLPTLPQLIPELQFSKIWIFTNNLLRHFSTYTPLPPPQDASLFDLYTPNALVWLTQLYTASPYLYFLRVLTSSFFLLFYLLLLITVTHCIYIIFFI